MGYYTVKQVAKLSGVSVRTLHHYDDVGLLEPAFIGENRYRYYGRDELLRLQDILFHRELGVPLREIAQILARGGSDRVAILREHRRKLAHRVERSRRLLRTIDRTIAELTGEGIVDDSKLYHGFAPEKQTEYEEWLTQNYGDGMRESIARSKLAVQGLSKEEMADVMNEGREAEAALAERFNAGVDANDSGLEPLLDRHRAWTGTMWNRVCTPAAYAGLADIYLAHPDFRSHFDEYGAGFTDWLVAAMKNYAARMR